MKTWLFCFWCYSIPDTACSSLVLMAVSTTEHRETPHTHAYIYYTHVHTNIHIIHHHTRSHTMSNVNLTHSHTRQERTTSSTNTYKWPRQTLRRKAYNTNNYHSWFRVVSTAFMFLYISISQFTWPHHVPFLCVCAVREAAKKGLVAVEVCCWFYVGEIIGRRSLIGYNV